MNGLFGQPAVTSGPQKAWSNHIKSAGSIKKHLTRLARWVWKRVESVVRDLMRGDGESTIFKHFRTTITRRKGSSFQYLPNRPPWWRLGDLRYLHGWLNMPGRSHLTGYYERNSWFPLSNLHLPITESIKVFPFLKNMNKTTKAIANKLVNKLKKFPVQLFLVNCRSQHHIVYKPKKHE